MTPPKRLNNQDGLTLVEVLAVLIISLFVGSILFSIIIQGQNQYKGQSQTNNNITDISYSLKVFTKDIRKAKNVKILNSNSIKLSYEAGIEDTIVYSPTEKKLTKNGNEYLRDVEIFKISDNGISTIIDIKFKTLNEKDMNKNIEVSTQIVVRSGD